MSLKPSRVVLTLATAMLLSNVSVAHVVAGDDKEKCYGVTKAGKNDCASASNSHGCAGLAKTDDAKDEWILLPKGVCERLTGGSTTASK